MDSRNSKDTQLARVTADSVSYLMSNGKLARMLDNLGVEKAARLASAIDKWGEGVKTLVVMEEAARS